METWADTPATTKGEVKTSRRVLADCIVLCKSQLGVQSLRIEVSWVVKSVVVQGPNLFTVLVWIPSLPMGWLESSGAGITHIHHHYRTFWDSLAMICIILLCCMRYSTTDWTGSPCLTFQSENLHTSDETSISILLTPQRLLHDSADVWQVRPILPQW